MALFFRLLLIKIEAILYSNITHFMHKAVVHARKDQRFGIPPSQIISAVPSPR